MKNILAALMVVFLCVSVQAAELAPQGPFRAFDDNGNPCTGCKLHTYEAGTTTNKDTFTDASGDTANTNPVILSSDGYADVWLGDGGYKFVLRDADDATIWTLDDISGGSANAFGDFVTPIATNTTITSAYENNLIVTTSSPTLSLLSAASAGEGFTFAVQNSDSGATTLDPNGSETISGSSTLSLGVGDSALVFSDGTNWIALKIENLEGSVNSFSAVNTFASDLIATGIIKLTGRMQYRNDGELTISSGAVTITGASHTIDTESDAASDDLDTVNGSALNGDLLLLRPENTARTVVIKHNTGNILTPSGLDITLDSTEKFAILHYDNALAKWVVVGFADVYSKDEIDTLVDASTGAESSQTVDGQIYKAGTVTGSSGSVTFATAFPNNIRGVIMGSETVNRVPYHSSPATTGFNWNGQIMTTGAAGSGTFSWIAWGD